MPVAGRGRDSGGQTIGESAEDLMEHQGGSLKGHFLIAMPKLMDPNFHQTVTIICEHNADGAFGIIVNRVHTAISAEDVFKELKLAYTPAVADIPIHIGGPVHSGEIFVVHGPPLNWEASLIVSTNLALSNTRDIIEAIAQVRGPQALIMSLGCAGWGPGQLESELRDNAWLTTPAVDDILFGCPLERRWEEAVRRMGVDPALLIHTAGNA
jgi:putative transcriptional regulator